ncbi:hypothetical protein EGI22_16035 [Lacihabitans sp. LS3-19]|uniref:hypothetical protein n=1 Tax=Lacihabitans sp. LS3-19 TaxID=2487335 RepID=UPI0020CD4FE4|nr:hypothetical protein [Lacihabitans sp. LS3-19]MCP9769413.1 hypothetical protein [Lacihabitans sp. LS3-19]
MRKYLYFLFCCYSSISLISCNGCSKRYDSKSIRTQSNINESPADLSQNDELGEGDKIYMGSSKTNAESGLTLGVSNVHHSDVVCNYQDVNNYNRTEYLDPGEGFVYNNLHGEQFRVVLSSMKYDNDDSKCYGVFTFTPLPSTKVTEMVDDEFTFTKTVKYRGTFMDEKFGTGFRIEEFNPKGTEGHIKGIFVVNGDSKFIELYKNEYWSFESKGQLYKVTVESFPAGAEESVAIMKIRKIVDSKELKKMKTELDSVLNE